jgi:hypothetical protein
MDKTLHEDFSIMCNIGSDWVAETTKQQLMPKKSTVDFVLNYSKALSAKKSSHLGEMLHLMN